MKLSSTLLVGTLAVLAPLAAASGSTAEGNNLAVRNLHVEPRDEGTCGVGRHRKHHKKGRKHKQVKQQFEAASIISVKAPIRQQHHHKHKTSSARPSHYNSGTQQQTKQPQQQQKQPQQQTNKAPASTTTPTTGASSGSSSSSPMSAFEKTMLDMHNADRALHSASPLTWSSTLASAAASWAKGCRWMHTPNNPYGQNIAAGTAPTFGAKDSCTMWYDEISQYKFAAGQYSDATGHFTQMVWKGSKRLGCAIQECTAEQMGLGSAGTARYVVCNYDPPGNVIGDFLANVSQN